MPVTTTTERTVISSSSWWVWILLAVGVVIVLLVVYGGWRLWRGATQVVREEVPQVVATPNQTTIRFVRTPTEIIVIDDPIIPDGEDAVKAIVNNFDQYQGKEVVVSGSVTAFESTAFFSVQQDEDSIGVIALPGAVIENQLEAATDPKNQLVRVTGTVKLLTKEREKKEFGFDFKNLNEAFWQDQMVIEAKTIEVVQATTT